MHNWGHWTSCMLRIQHNFQVKLSWNWNMSNISHHLKQNSQHRLKFNSLWTPYCYAHDSITFVNELMVLRFRKILILRLLKRLNKASTFGYNIQYVHVVCIILLYAQELTNSPYLYRSPSKIFTGLRPNCDGELSSITMGFVRDPRPLLAMIAVDRTLIH